MPVPGLSTAKVGNNMESATRTEALGRGCLPPRKGLANVVSAVFRDASHRLEQSISVNHEIGKALCRQVKLKKFKILSIPIFDRAIGRLDLVGLGQPKTLYAFDDLVPVRPAGKRFHDFSVLDEVEGGR